MNIALIFAGGCGHRMNSKSLPKQFLTVNGKPIIIHTLEVFDRHPQIDAIIVSCVAEYITWLEEALVRFQIHKVKAVTAGGKTGQLSIKNGLEKACELFPADSVVLIHDGVRPLIDLGTITNNIASVLEHGSAVTVTPASETVGILGSHGDLGDIIKRQQVVICRAPQSFRLGEVLASHRRALADGLTDITDTASLMRIYGKKLATITGPVDNIKITTQRDFYTLKTLFDLREFRQLLETKARE